MLEQVCDYVHNYFIRHSYTGQLTITGGTIPYELLDGQRFRVRGSALNDGIYTYHAAGVKNDDDNAASPLADETFTGSIDAMGVPKAFTALVSEISAWVQANAAALSSPYTSESFGGYSYTKATGSGANAGGVLGWQDMYRAKLNAYRKLA